MKGDLRVHFLAIALANVMSVQSMFIDLVFDGIAGSVATIR
ncbi:hypothetical Protein YC6258_03190 [Gynuella sunshinyii YC6258]|uniref:Uncharacterized protein n=1 Tax=Gynuella sunshinyii YC6258 TaxID=1445510 RepID=A0A0C5VLR6_9GAMM|nr:hypothetical Protein YC6258_03190 [Gynuella sunshinyii YC6258]